MTAIFLAWNSNPWAHRSLAEWDWENRPIHLLASFAYLKEFKKQAVEYGRPLSVMLDSGAYTAWKSGKTIDIDALVAEVLEGQCPSTEGGFEWDQCVALDAIGDPERSMVNARYMQEKGCRVIPVFHYGEPWEVLEEYCQLFGHVGLSCRFGESIPDAIRWVEQCFARQWPHLFHSFGWIDSRILLRVPFDTCDAATWQMAPTAFGRWMSYGGIKLPKVRCNNASELRIFTEIEHYLKLQRKLEERWHKQLTPLRQSILGESLTNRRTLWI
jgi:hypothetical protein